MVIMTFERPLWAHKEAQRCFECLVACLLVQNLSGLPNWTFI